jgi:hypothetical protein
MLGKLVLIPLLLLGACAWTASPPLPHTACLATSGPANAVPQDRNPALRGKSSG